MPETPLPLPALRFVVLDTESTGFDPRTDRLVTIGAVAVQAGEIRLDDAFEALLRISHNTSAVTVHGVTRDEGRAGLEEGEALRRFLEYAEGAVLVGHHVAHDVALLEAACARHLEAGLKHPTVDTADLCRHLARAGALRNDAPGDGSLDALCAYFGIEPRDRHTAAGDAFLTAQVFLRLLRAASRAGRNTLESLSEPFPEESDRSSV